MKGHNGDFSYDSTGSAVLEFFSKAGSLFEKRQQYYGGETSALNLFKPAFKTDKVRAAKLAFWLRDARGGAGNRSGFRSVINWMSINHPEWVKLNIKLIPESGRWQDLISCVNTPCEDVAIKFWADAISRKDGLACKWAPRENKNKEVYAKLRKAMGMSPKEFRKHLSENSNTVEQAMCSGNWEEIDYNTVPSVAMARSRNAFLKHDPARFDEWKTSLSDPESTNKVNASVLFPHDVLRTLNVDKALANSQFEALPNYMEGTDFRIMPICDFSGSMGTLVSGSIRAMDISTSLGLYCSDKVGKDNPFYRKLIPFSAEARMIDWKNGKFDHGVKLCGKEGYCGSTNIKSALDLILNSASMFNVPNDQMPNCLLIISDMQFDQGCSGAEETAVEACMKRWEQNGYTRPRIVYWNTAGNAGSPSTRRHKNVGLVSGFSPSILKSILGGTEFTPMAILDRAIEKYNIVVPE